MRLILPLLALLLPAVSLASQTPATADDPVLRALDAELAALRDLLGPGPATALADSDHTRAHPAYHLAVQAVELQRIRIVGEEGGLQGWAPQRGRWVHVDVRVGSPALDSTHPLRDGSYDESSSGRTLPVGDDVALLRRTVRQEAETRYRAAVDRYQRVLSDRQVLVAEEEGLDLAPATAAVLLEELSAPLPSDWTEWEETIRAVSAVFADDDVALDPSVSLAVDREIRWFVSTDGHRSRVVETRARISVGADTRAPDGSELYEDWSADAGSADALPGRAALLDAARAVQERLRRLRAAPEEPPYRGPAILSGRAAAVFFHEILGHRVEGHRLKHVADAQTFRDKIGEEVLPAFLSVTDDPTRAEYGGVALRGHYAIDDQGEPGARVVLVQDGRLRGFLESRSPVHGERGNGHGRRQAGMDPVARQGSLLIESSRALPEAELRARLLTLAKEQGLAYGLLVDDLEGGFTFTDRDLPNAFQIDVRTARRVFVDGRPDQLVRGVDLIGTPLQTFSRIVATGDRPAVFNGTCGAESGWVPVSAAAPPMLFSQVESQRKMKGQTPPPLSGPPPTTPPARLEGAPPLLDAIVAEIHRAKDSLRLPGAPAPQRISAEVWDRDAHEVVAEFGVLVASGGGPSRPGRVEVVVGNDSVNSMRFEGGGRLDLPTAAMTPRLVIDDRPAALRRDLWLGADRAYLGAVPRLSLKHAELAARRDEARPPDWTVQPAQVHLDPREPAPVDAVALDALALALSRVPRGVEGLRVARVSGRSEQGRLLMADTDGMRVAQTDGYAVLVLELEALRPDGVPVRDRLSWVAATTGALPPLADLKREADTAVLGLLARRAASVLGAYEGPVVFEGDAAADLFRYLLPGELEGTPPPLEAGTSVAAQERSEPRIGRRLLPPRWSVVDDPSSAPEGQAGAAELDREGVPGRRTALLDDGYVVDLLMSRVPRPDRSGSTGHARGDVGGPPEARMSWWEVRPGRGLSRPAFARQVARARKAARLPGVLVVQRFAPGWVGDLPETALALIRDGEGRELPVVSLEWEGVDRRTLRQIVAATAARTTRGYLAPGRGGGLAPTTNGLPSGLVAPESILVEGLEAVFGGETEEASLLPLLPLD